ncbi:MAG: 4-hydroxy-3-methylbut-2-enyl diphosphate reductase [Bacillota bacterium]|jgi:4-hydroxy-3-methylbut-2-enyl diphosphate reductase|nr:4-hydroxy-3-methylbut-2-enyl diphosphate reductase [Bacillota bacterium]NLP21885.1 4-hydroxy-3-methylbut-2-enyl diphosphate reductase [Erysipelotrichaceae bacterium]
MNIITVTPRGYCKGVINAINLVKQTRKENPNEKITMLGMIVHNKYVVKAFEEIGIKCIDAKNKTRLELLDEVDSGIVIITAHGASEEVTIKAKEKGLKVVDATCIDVIKTHKIVKEHIKHGDVIYIGKKTHPEAEAIVSISNKVHLISNLDDVDNLPKDLFNPLITNQTTMSLYNIEILINACLLKYKNAKVAEEICNATRIRQEAVRNLKDVDTLLVVGDVNSNNSNQLRNIGLNSGIKNAYLIETVNDLTKEMLENFKTVAITSGASTPTYLTSQVIEKLKEYIETKELKKEIIDITKII